MNILDYTKAIEQMRNVKNARLEAQKSVTVTENKTNIFWTTADNHIIPIQDLGDTHILNIISYIIKRQEDFIKIKELAAIRGLTIARPLFRERPAEFWLDTLLKELDSRAKEQTEKAKELVKLAKQNLENIKNSLKD